jgi:hypothetical protein
MMSQKERGLKVQPPKWIFAALFAVLSLVRLEG